MAVKISDLPPGGPVDGTEDVPAVQGGVTVRLSPLQLGSRLASHVFTTPVAYIDLALPVGYVSFVIQFSGIVFNVSDTIAAALSQNGGSSFINDTTNFDSYIQGGNEVYTNVLTGANSGGSVGAGDSVISFVSLNVISQILNPSFGISSILELFPGSSTQVPNGIIRSVWERTDTSPIEVVRTSLMFSLNPAAVVPPSKIRATTIRIQPYGNGDVNPPTSGHTITAGEIILWGVLP